MLAIMNDAVIGDHGYLSDILLSVLLAAYS